VRKNPQELRSQGFFNIQVYFEEIFRDDPGGSDKNEIILKKGPTDYPETSVMNYHYTVRKNPQEIRSQGFF